MMLSQLYIAMFDDLPKPQGSCETAIYLVVKWNTFLYAYRRETRRNQLQRE